MVYVDHFLKMGNNHEICEDYIYSNQEDLPWVILSDGCSSSQNTDVGARILTHVARQYLEWSWLFKGKLSNTVPNYHVVASWIINKARHISDLFNLPFSCLDATLMIATVLNNSVHVYIYGDGFILIESHKGEFTRYSIDYEPNAPKYISYLIDPKRGMNYHNRNVKCSIDVIGEDLRYPGWEGIEPFIFSFSIKDIQTLLVSSDGIATFDVDVDQVQKEFLNFKKSKVKTRFVKRRVGNAIRKYEKSKILHSDDIAIGGFQFLRGES